MTTAKNSTAAIVCPWKDPVTEMPACTSTFVRPASLRDHCAKFHGVFLRAGSMDEYYEPPLADLMERVTKIDERRVHRHSPKFAKTTEKPPAKPKEAVCSQVKSPAVRAKVASKVVAAGKEDSVRVERPKSTKKRSASSIRSDGELDDSPAAVDVECFPPNEKKHADIEKHKRTDQLNHRPVVGLTDVCHGSSSTPRPSCSATSEPLNETMNTTSEMVNRAANLETVFRAVAAATATPETVAESSGALEITAILGSAQSSSNANAGLPATNDVAATGTGTVTLDLTVLRPMLQGLLVSPLYGQLLQERFRAGPCRGCVDKILRNVAGLPPR